MVSIRFTKDKTGIQIVICDVNLKFYSITKAYTYKKHKGYA